MANFFMQKWGKWGLGLELVGLGLE